MLGPGRFISLSLSACGLLIAAASQVAAQPYYYPAYPPARQGPAYGDPYADYPPYETPRARPVAPARRVQPPVAAYDYPDVDEDYPPLDLQPRARSRAGARVASLPPDADPAYSSLLNHDDEVDLAEVSRQVVADPTRQAAGTITINTGVRKLYLSLGDGRAIEYGIGVGRQGFAWKGNAQIGRKAFWPGWTPPPDMVKRRPDLPRHMDGGMDNPLGARALYLFQGNKDTLFRIHGTNEPDTIGHAVSSGCIRMLNADVMDLYQRVRKGAHVVVL